MAVSFLAARTWNNFVNIASELWPTSGISFCSDGAEVRILWVLGEYFPTARQLHTTLA